MLLQNQVLVLELFLAKAEVEQLTLQEILLQQTLALVAVVVLTLFLAHQVTLVLVAAVQLKVAVVMEIGLHKQVVVVAQVLLA